MCTKIELDNITSEVSEKVQEFLGDKLKKIILYGSYARGDYDDESDIDIMVLADTKDEEENERMYLRDKFSDIASDMGIENNIFISILFKNYKFFYDNIDVLPFYQNVIKDGVVLYG